MDDAFALDMARQRLEMEQFSQSFLDLLPLFGNISIRDVLRNHSYYSQLLNESHFAFINEKRLWNEYNGGGDLACEIIKQYPEKHTIYLILTLVVIAIGLFGNCLSIGVFLSRAMALISSNVYLLSLAISDTLYLITVFLTRGLTSLRCLYFHNSHFDIFNKSVLMCKLLQYILDLLSDFSSCLIIAFTVERFIACYKPLKYKSICTVSRARRMCLFLLLLISTSIFPSHIFLIGHSGNYEFCTVLTEYEKAFAILYMTEATIFRILPVLGIAVINVLIIVGVASISRNKDKSRASSYGGTDPGQQSQTSLLNTSDSGTAIVRRDHKQRQLTVMLVLVSSAYIITSIPLLLHFLLWKLNRANVIHIPMKTMDDYQNWGRLLYITGFSLNFFLYTISGSLYRKHLILLLKRMRGCSLKGRGDSLYSNNKTAVRMTMVTNGSPMESVAKLTNDAASDIHMKRLERDGSCTSSKV